MSVVITSKTFFDEFTGDVSIDIDGDAVPDNGGGVGYVNDPVLSKVKAQLDFYSFLSTEGKTLTFDSATKTITNTNETDTSSFLNDGSQLGKGFKVGMTIAIEGTVSNNATRTINAVTARVITVVEAIINETALTASIFDDTPITALDLYYNLIENKLPESYLSLTDRDAIQRFTVDGINASVTGTTKNMMVSSSSFGWVTNTLTNPVTGSTSEVTIVGMGITAHKQKFRIKQIFHVAPFFVREQLANFQDRFPPEYFKDEKALKYICRIDTKFSFTNPDIPHTGSSTDVNGLTCWFDQNNIKSKPEYFVDTVAYEEDITALPLSRLDLNKTNKVTVTLKSRSAKFNASTIVCLDFLYLPLGEDDYINTPDTTLRQNLMNDRKLIVPIFGVVNGEYFGTDYQILTAITTTLINASTLEIEFTVAFSTYLKNILKARSSDNRNYAISITTQDKLITSTIQTDRVAVLCDVDNMDWDQDDVTLLEAVDTFRNYHYPNVDSEPKNNVAGYEGDLIYTEFPFRLQTLPSGTTATLKLVAMQIVAVKTGKTDFILEEKQFDVSQVRKLENVQTINIEETRNFTYINDEHLEYNKIKLERKDLYDVGTKKGFLFSYPFVLRYEFWNQVILLVEGARYNVFENVEKVTNEWSNYADAGWALKLRFFADVEGYDGHVTHMVAEKSITAQKLGRQAFYPGDSTPIFTVEVFYYDESGVLIGHTDSTNVEGGSIVIGGRTRIVAKFTGNPTPPTGSTTYGYIFADLENEGGINLRRFASSEIVSESDSPWTATDPDGAATSTRAFGNARLNIYGITHATIEAWYDDRKENWSDRKNTILIYPRMGFFSGVTSSARRFDNDVLHQWDNDVQADFEP